MIEWESFGGPFESGKPKVHRDGHYVMLQFGPASVQSQMQLDDPFRLQLGYTRSLMGFLLFVPAPRTITMIGLGGGSLPKFCYRHLPIARIDVVEICPEVIALRDTFHVPEDNGRFRIHCDDGARFVAARESSEDVIIVDGFDVEGQAPALCTEDFYRDCRRALSLGGVLAINFSENSKQHATYFRRLQRVFGDQVLVVKSEDCTNKIAFAIKQSAGDPSTFSQADLLQCAGKLDKQYPLSFRQLVERLALNRLNRLD
jgi:spermidine synthase